MEYRKQFIVEAGSRVKLDAIDPGFKDRHEHRESAATEIEHYRQRLSDLQYRLYAERKRSLLIVFQALDAGGKDGVIRHVMSTVNPQGCRVTCFKKPTAEEAGHDFLWRIHPAAPARGEIAIFNRSHYEDVLVARVHRRDADYEERRYWDDYQAAFEDALSECSTTHVPWFVIPANHKGFRDLAVSQIIVETLESLKMELPEPTVNIPQIRRQYHAAAEEQKTGDASAAVPGTTAIDRP